MLYSMGRAACEQTAPCLLNSALAFWSTVLFTPRRGGGAGGRRGRRTDMQKRDGKEEKYRGLIIQRNSYSSNVL